MLGVIDKSSASLITLATMYMSYTPSNFATTPVYGVGEPDHLPIGEWLESARVKHSAAIVETILFTKRATDV
ncbi:hypothetical protein RHSA111115_05090 [Rheinheimera salexigens]